MQDLYLKEKKESPGIECQQITENFNDSEFLCKCDNPNCVGKIPGLISEHFVRRLQRLRDLLKQPIIVTSGIRCIQHNFRIGGSPDSYHLIGHRCAADIATEESLKTKCSRDIWLIAEMLGFSGMGYLNGVVHLDLGDRFARWVLTPEGKYLYLF